MSVQFGIHDANELLQSRQLLLHPALVAEEVPFLHPPSSVNYLTIKYPSMTYHPIHDFDEAPEREFFVRAHNHVDWCAEIRHSLHIAFVAYESASLPVICPNTNRRHTKFLLIEVVCEQNGGKAFDVVVAGGLGANVGNMRRHD